MCGIIGHIGNAERKINLRFLEHRGQDASKTWSNGTNCTLGHVRLSILDLDERSNQPMCDESKRYFIVFNGEIYNYLELRDTYLKDEKLKTTSDTEVLLRLWIKYKEDTLPKLRGMFAFAVWDNQGNKLWMARDRFGQKPLHYCQRNGGISFSSELNVLRKDLDNSFSINESAVGLFLRYQFIPAPHTIYNEVKKLLPAHYMVWENNESKIRRYWDINFDESFYSNISESDAIGRIEGKIKESVRIRLRSDVPVGSLLSGGVDSSLVTSIASELSSESLNTFSIGFSNKEYNELDYARMVADRYNTNHHEYVLKEDEALKYLSKSISQYGEPYGDKSSLPSLLVSQIAAENLKVVLNGDGGDELLGGYPKYKVNGFQRILSRYNRHKYILGKGINQVKKIGNNSLLDTALFQLNYSILNPYYRVIDFREFYEERHFSRLMNSEFSKADFYRDEQQFVESILSSVNRNTHPMNQLFKIDYQHYFANDLLVKMDIASMAYCLEVRSPLMDHELMEEASRLPVKFKRQNGEGKYLLKKIAEKYLPNELLYRKKMGFAIPVREWMKGQFGDQLLDLVADNSNTAWHYIDRDYLLKLYKEHKEDESNHEGRLWLALIISKWFDWSDKFEE